MSQKDHNQSRIPRNIATVAAGGSVDMSAIVVLATALINRVFFNFTKDYLPSNWEETTTIDPPIEDSPLFL